MRAQEFLAIGFFFLVTICFFLTWYFWHRARHRELMLMIEKGMDPAAHNVRTGKMLRKLAVIVVAIGIASALHRIIYDLGYRGINRDSGTLALFATCIGIALYIVNREKNPGNT